jgi:hypothetical protein
MERPQLLLPCYEHDLREYVKRCYWHIPLTPVYKLTPKEEKEATEDDRRAMLLDKLECGKLINKKELSKDEKYMIWKMKYLRKEVHDD